VTGRRSGRWVTPSAWTAVAVSFWLSLELSMFDGI